MTIENPSQPALAPRRYLPLVAAVGAVAVALLILDLAVSAIYRQVDGHRVAVDFLDIDRQASLARRIVEIESSWPGTAREPETLGVLLGQSTVREGLDIDVLGRAAGTATRWLNLGASGGSFLQLRFYARPLVASNLAPGAIIVGVHPQWLANPQAQIDDQRVRLERGGGFDAVLGTLWSWRERNSLRNLATFALAGLRQRGFESVGQPLRIQVPQDRGRSYRGDGRQGDDPWHAPRKYHALRATDSVWAKMREIGVTYGWYEPASYRADGVENRALLALLHELGARAEHLVVVLMPEHSTLREAVPPVASTLFHDVLAAYRAASGRPLSMLDHRAAIDDAWFFDLAHLNREGRARYSDFLGRTLVSAVPGLR